MKNFLLCAALAGIAAAAPAANLDARQVTGPNTSNDIIDGNCSGKKVALVWARASTEQGNMGDRESVGPRICAGLKTKYGSGSVACQGVGGAYKATLVANVNQVGTTQASINEGMKMLSDAVSSCDSATILAGGYSQGTALMMHAVSESSEDVRNKIAGVTLYGYTKNKQTGSGIPGYPTKNVAVYCAANDGVCGGDLVVTLGHFSYLDNGDIGKGLSFLESKIN